MPAGSIVNAGEVRENRQELCGWREWRVALLGWRGGLDFGLGSASNDGVDPNVREAAVAAEVFDVFLHDAPNIWERERREDNGVRRALVGEACRKRPRLLLRGRLEPGGEPSRSCEGELDGASNVRGVARGVDAEPCGSRLHRIHNESWEAVLGDPEHESMRRRRWRAQGGERSTFVSMMRGRGR